MASPKVGTPVDSVKTVKTVKSVKKVKTVRRAGLAREDLDHGISRLYAPGTASDYLIPTSCRRLPHVGSGHKKKPWDYQGF